MPLNMVLRLLGLVLAAVGVLCAVLGFLPENIAAMVPAQLKLTQGFAQSVGVFAAGAAVYLLSEIAAKRVSKTY